MKKLKRLEVVLLAFIIFGLALVGCSSKTSNDVVNDPQQNEAESESKTESLPAKEESESKTESLPAKEESESKTESLPVRWEIDDEDKCISGKIGDYIKIPDIQYVNDDDFLDSSSDFSCVSSDNSIVEPYNRYSGREVYLKHPGTATITMSLVVSRKDGVSVDCGSQDIEIVVEDPVLGNEPYISSRDGRFLEYKDNLCFFRGFDSMSNEDDGHYLLYNIDYSKDRKEWKLIDPGHIGLIKNYNVYKDKIYYTKSNEIYAMDVSGDNGRKIAEVSRDEIHSMHIIDGKLYYLYTTTVTDNKGRIECMSLDGEVLKKSSSYYNISEMQYYKGYLYFNAAKEENKNICLYRTDLDFNEVEFVRDDLHEYKLYNGSIYYYCRNIYKNTEKNGLYKYDMASKESTKIVDGVIGSFDILEDKIYYTYGGITDDYDLFYNKLGYCNIDGSESHLFSEELFYQRGFEEVYSKDDKVYIFSSEGHVHPIVTKAERIDIFNLEGEMSSIQFRD